MPEFAEIRSTVKGDWTAMRQEQLKDEAYARLRERYKVEIEGTEARASQPDGKRQATVVLK